MRTILVCLSGLFMVSAFADVGVVLAEKEENGLKIIIFAERAPLRVGVTHLQILVQDTRHPILDADVRLSLKRLSVPAGQTSWVSSYCKFIGSSAGTIATRDQAHNKLLYGAFLPISEVGKWELTVEIAKNDKVTTIALPLDVAASPKPLAVWWPLLTMVPLAIGLYSWRAALIQTRRARKNR